MALLRGSICRIGGNLLPDTPPPRSGNRKPLLAPRPLRTGRASFPATRSSHYEVHGSPRDRCESPPHVLATIDLPEVSLLSERCRAPIPRIIRGRSLCPDSFTSLPKGLPCGRLACKGFCRREEGLTTFRISHTSRVGATSTPTVFRSL